LHLNLSLTPTPVGTSTGASSHSLDEKLSDEERTVVRNLSAQSAVLIIQRGPSAGSRFLLDSAQESVGRHPESSIFLDDISVSRKHAMLSREVHGFSIADIGSLNGTYVNGDRVEKIDLHSGDEVRIGKYRLIYFTGDMS
jgi:hypothetical protein